MHAVFDLEEAWKRIESIVLDEYGRWPAEHRIEFGRRFNWMFHDIAFAV